VPTEFTFSPDGTRAYISCESEHAVGNGHQDRQAHLQAKLSAIPTNVSVSKDGKYVFVGIPDEPSGGEVERAPSHEWPSRRMAENLVSAVTPRLRKKWPASGR